MRCRKHANWWDWSWRPWHSTHIGVHPIDEYRGHENSSGWASKRQPFERWKIDGHRHPVRLPRSFYFLIVLTISTVLWVQLELERAQCAGLGLFNSIVTHKAPFLAVHQLCSQERQAGSRSQRKFCYYGHLSSCHRSYSRISWARRTSFDPRWHPWVRRHLRGWRGNFETHR